MAFYYIVLVALVQGITEFLPISSSAHLVLLPNVLGHSDQGLMIDVAAHFGTMLAVCAYFFKDVLKIAAGGFDTMMLKTKSDNAQLFINIVIATLPVIICGFIIHEFFLDFQRGLEVIAFGTIFFAILLYIADNFFMNVNKFAHMNKRDALLIGLAQIFSLFPGASRSGVTMTMGRFLGYERPVAAQFSLLLSIPTILGAATLTSYKMIKLGDVSLTIDALITAAVSAFIAYITIYLLMNWLKRASFTIFVVYRLVLGFGLIGYLYLG